MATTVSFDASKSPIQMLISTDQHVGQLKGTVSIGSDSTPYQQNFVRNPVTITDSSGAAWKLVSDDLGFPQSKLVYSL